MSKKIVTKRELILADLQKKPNISNKLLAKRYAVVKDYIYQIRSKYNIPMPYDYCVDNGRTLVRSKRSKLRSEAKVKTDKKVEAEITKLVEAKNAEVKQHERNLDAILKERGNEYGTFSEQARITQALRNTAHRFANDHGKVFTADQALALDMIFVKLGRILSGNPNHLDSWIDIAGYARLVSDRMRGITQ